MSSGGPDNSNKPTPTLDAVCGKLGIGSIKRHMFICIGPKCVSESEGLATWDWLKKRLAEPDMKGFGVYRTKVGCLRVCQKGPIALVYPEGTWYRDADQSGCAKIVEQHLKQGVPVDELCFATGPLPKI